MIWNNPRGTTNWEIPYICLAGHGESIACICSLHDHTLATQLFFTGYCLIVSQNIVLTTVWRKVLIICITTCIYISTFLREMLFSLLSYWQRHKMKMLSLGINLHTFIWSSPFKWKCHHFDEIFITGCIESGHFDHFQCSQWWKFH